MAKIAGNYNPETKMSIVTIKDKHGIYTGIAKLHPNDTPNKITGCIIAEMRATKKRLKARCNNLRIKIKTLKSFEKEVTNYAPYECENSLIMDRLHITIKAYERELHDTLAKIIAIKQQEKNDKLLREKIRSKMNK